MLVGYQLPADWHSLRIRVTSALRAKHIAAPLIRRENPRISFKVARMSARLAASSVLKCYLSQHLPRSRSWPTLAGPMLVPIARHLARISGEWPPESDTPRKAGGLMSRAASKAVGSLVKASRPARSIQGSELPCCSIRFLLLADVEADFFEFKPDRGNGVPASPQVLTGEAPFFTTESGNGNGAFPFQEPDD